MFLPNYLEAKPFCQPEANLHSDYNTTRGGLRTKIVRLAAEAAIGLLFFCSVLALQWRNGAFRNEFGGHSDEAAHFVTGLMVRDYIAALDPTSPRQFAENYYLHYPKVAIGHWPPFFYLVQAAWILLFSPSRSALILLMGSLCTALAFTIYRVIKTEFGSLIGIVASLLFIALPVIQEYSGMVMAEILLALLSFWAALCFGRFLETEDWRLAAGFGILAMLAVMTKGNGLALAFVPPVAVVLSGRWRLISRLSFWLPAAIILLVSGPWYWVTRNMQKGAWPQPVPTFDYNLKAIQFYSLHSIKVIGIGLAIFVVIGFTVRVILPLRAMQVEGKWAALASLLLGVGALSCAVPVGLEERFLIPALPAVMVFLAAGMAWVGTRLPIRRLKTTVLSSAVALVFVVETFANPLIAFYGFRDVACLLVSKPEFQGSVILVSSDSEGEGMLISEIAMRERRPGHIVLRAGKVLADTNWYGTEYKTLYRTPEEVMNYLQSIPVRIVVEDLSVPAKSVRQHHRLLRESLRAYSENWEFLGSYAMTRQGIKYPDSIRIYRLRDGKNRPPGTIRVDMRRMLNKTLELKSESPK